MTLPTTFSAPGTAYRPSVHDCLRDGIYLMLLADDLNRKAFSYDDADPSKGVRIRAEVEQTDDDGRLVTPQQIIAVGFGSSRFTLDVSRGGTLKATVNIGILEANTSGGVSVDVGIPPVTVLAKLARVHAILMRGTLYAAGQPTNNSQVIDPYNSELNEDGTYDQSALRVLNTIAPEIVYAPPRSILRKKPTTEEELLRALMAIDLARDSAVLYGLSATYTIDMTSREDLELGGFANG